MATQADPSYTHLIQLNDLEISVIINKSYKSEDGIPGYHFFTWGHSMVFFPESNGSYTLEYSLWPYQKIHTIKNFTVDRIGEIYDDYFGSRTVEVIPAIKQLMEEVLAEMKLPTETDPLLPKNN